MFKQCVRTLTPSSGFFWSNRAVLLRIFLGDFGKFDPLALALLNCLEAPNAILIPRLGLVGKLALASDPFVILQ